MPIEASWGLRMQVSSTNTFFERHARESDPYLVALCEPGCTVSADAPRRPARRSCSSVVAARRPGHYETADGVGR